MLVVIAVVLIVFGIGLAFSALAALLRARLFRFTLRALGAVVFLVIGVALGVVAIGVRSLQSLDPEQTAARIQVVPTGPQAYDATVRLADGRTQTYAIAGDDIYVDAHIVKWTPLGNQLGLSTSYRLDRIAGRYRSLEQEATARRTVYALMPSGPVDLVELARRFPLAALFDAEYGSATYVPVVRPEELELRVSNSGLLMRSATPVAAPLPPTTSTQPAASAGR